MQEVVIKPFEIIGITVRTSNANGQAAKDIGALWSRFLSENLLEKIPNKIDDTIYSIYTEYEGDHNQPYATLLGCKVEKLEEIPSGMVSMSFAGGTYIKTSVKGDIMKGIVGNKWMEIWEMDIDRAYSADFEVYGKKAQNPSDAEIDFYIAIHK